MRTTSALLCIAAATAPLCTADLYARNSPVLQLDAKSYQSGIVQSNYTSIVEFYAPWCGHCKNLQPAYEKAAKALNGVANVAAVNCDEESNKPFCGSMGVQGFPTLKIIKPGKKVGKPSVQDYTGQRTAKDIVEAVKMQIPNHVTRLADKDVYAWLEADKDEPKALLFSDKKRVSPLLKALAIDFLGKVPVAMIRDAETAAVERFAISTYPTLVLLPGNGAEAVVYSGKMEKAPMVEFLAQAAKPNIDPARKPAKETQKSKAAKTKKPAESTAYADGTWPAEVDPEDDVAPLTIIASDKEVKNRCLTTTSGICLLFIYPTQGSAKEQKQAMSAIAALAEIHHKHKKRGGKSFPFYQALDGDTLRKELDLGDGLVVIVVNGKKGWIRHYAGEPTQAAIEDWVDGVRLGDGQKSKIPAGVLIETAAFTAASDAASSASETAETVAETVSSAAESIAEQAKSASESVAEQIETQTEDVKAKASEAVERATDKVADVVEQVTDKVADVVEQVTEKVANVVDQVTASAADTASVSTSASGVAESVVEQLKSQTDNVKDKASKVVEQVVAAAKGAAEQVGIVAESETTPGIVEQASSKASEVVDQVTAAAESIASVAGVVAESETPTGIIEQASSKASEVVDQVTAAAESIASAAGIVAESATATGYADSVTEEIKTQTEALQATASDVAGAAEDGAQQVLSQAAEKAEQVKSAVTGDSDAHDEL